MPVKERYRKNPDKHTELSKSYYYKNREKVLVQVKKYKVENPEKIKERNKKFWDKIKNDPILKAKNDDRLKKYAKSFIGRYNQYKNGALNRKLAFLLTQGEFRTFWAKPCHYCSEGIETIGLDRVNNKMGYTLNNIVSCCTPCNRMKKAVGYKEFISRCLRIGNNKKLYEGKI